MSHFTITVALPGDIAAEPDELFKILTETLAPFDEQLEMPRYVEHTREQLIAKGRQSIEHYKASTYAAYLADPADYAAKCRNPSHLEYLMGTGDDGGFPAKLEWTDEQVYQNEIRWYEPEDIGTDGEVYSISNPKGQWDWWVVGGRWGGAWTLRDGIDGRQYPRIPTRESAFGPSDRSRHPQAVDCARIRDINASTFNSTWGYLTLDGDWVEKGRMGWFGMSDADESTDAEIRWKKAYLDWIGSMPDSTWVINVDCHT